MSGNEDTSAPAEDSTKERQASDELNGAVQTKETVEEELPPTNETPLLDDGTTPKEKING